MKKIYILIVVISLFSEQFMNSQSTVKFVQPDFLRGGLADAQKLFSAYLTPWGNMFGASLNGGWYNTAKPHKTLGFDITLSTIMSFAPSTAGTFDVSSLGLTNLQLVDPNAPKSPTISGSPGTQGAEVVFRQTYMGTAYDIAKFKLPNGAGLNFFPLPMAQIGLGLFKGTEIIGRFVPTIKFGSVGSMGLWGVGLKHSLFQHIPLQKAVPIDISLVGGYSKLSSSANIDFPLDPSFIQTNYTAALHNYSNQSMNINTTAMTGCLVFSTTIPIFNVYAGVGYSYTKTQLLLKGDYAIPTSIVTTPGPDLGKPAITDADVHRNPFDIEIKNKSGLRYNIGVRLKLALLTIHVDYTYDLYSVVSTGLGLSFR